MLQRDEVRYRQIKQISKIFLDAWEKYGIYLTKDTNWGN